MNYAYDPEMPYLMLCEGKPFARFREPVKSVEFEDGSDAEWELVDTTPLKDGYYLYGRSGVFYLEEGTKWYDVSNSWIRTDYPAKLPKEDLKKMTVEGEE